MNSIQTQNLFRLAGKQLKSILKAVAGNDFDIPWSVLWEYISSRSY